MIIIILKAIVLLLTCSIWCIILNYCLKVQKELEELKNTQIQVLTDLREVLTNLEKNINFNKLLIDDNKDIIELNGKMLNFVTNEIYSVISKIKNIEDKKRN